MLNLAILLEVFTSQCSHVEQSINTQNFAQNKYLPTWLYLWLKSNRQELLETMYIIGQIILTLRFTCLSQSPHTLNTPSCSGSLNLTTETLAIRIVVVINIKRPFKAKKLDYRKFKTCVNSDNYLAVVKRRNGWLQAIRSQKSVLEYNVWHMWHSRRHSVGTPRDLFVDPKASWYLCSEPKPYCLPEPEIWFTKYMFTPMSQENWPSMNQTN